MGYALWIDEELACAEGAHEYRAWGTAIVGVKTQFRLKDFRRTPGKRAREGKEFVGLFASLEEVNRFLRECSAGTGKRRNAARLRTIVADLNPFDTTL